MDNPTDNVSTKLNTVLRARAVNDRTDRMFLALRQWRVAIVECMAKRVAEIGSAPDDSEMLVLCREFRLWELTAQALHADPSGLLVIDQHFGNTPR